MTDHDDDAFERRSARIERRDEAGSARSPGGGRSDAPTEEQKARAAEMRDLKASRRLLDEGSDD